MKYFVNINVYLMGRDSIWSVIPDACVAILVIRNHNFMKNITHNSLLVRRLISSASFVLAVVMIAGLPFVASAQMLTRQLQLGMSGSDVSTLQSFLAKDITIYPQGIISGYFGSLTKSAVSNFQARNGIATVGRVGPQTLVAINNQMGGIGGVSGDAQAPWINPVTVSATNQSATMSWTTNENASAVVYFGTSPLSMVEGSTSSAVTIGGSSMLVHTNLQTSHSATLTTLSPNTTYYYAVYVKDAAGNESLTWPSTFRTSN